VFEWNPNAALARLAAPGKTVVAGNRTLALPVNLGAVELIAFELPAQIKPGETLTLLTVWRVRDPGTLGPPPARDYAHRLAVFCQVLGGASVIAQEDRLDAPAWNWRAGDSVAQLHRVPIKPDTPAGERSLHIGLYRRDTSTRLPVYVSGAVLDDHIGLGPVQITSSP